MAVGTVSGIEQENNWQLIASNSPTGTTTAASFTSISGYKRVMVVWKALRTGANAWLYLKVNNDTTVGNYVSSTTYSNANNNESESLLVLDGTDRTNHTGMIVIENVDKATPHEVSNFAAYQTTQWTQGILSSAPITRIDLYNSVSNFSSGTVELWGVAS
jgi:hypothetical protein